MGIINVYTGPMKCGKSQKIFNELKRQLIAGKNIKVFKPLLDNRAGDAVISTRAVSYTHLTLPTILTV